MVSQEVQSERGSSESEQTYLNSRTLTDEIISDVDISDRTNDNFIRKSVSANDNNLPWGQVGPAAGTERDNSYKSELFRIFSITKKDRRYEGTIMEKCAFEEDQNYRPRRYIKKAITGFDTEKVSLNH